MVPPLAAYADTYDDAMHAYDSGRYSDALAQWKDLARHGHVQAQYNLGFMYEFGYGTAISDSNAFQWYLHAAQSGHVQAQRSVAWMYKLGKGIERNRIAAARWTRLVQASEAVLDTASADAVTTKSASEQGYAAALLEFLRSEFELASERYEAQKAGAPPPSNNLDARNQTS